MIPSSWVHLSTLMNRQLPSLLLQITGTVRETRDGGKASASELGGRKGGGKALAAFNEASRDDQTVLDYIHIGVGALWAPIELRTSLSVISKSLGRSAKRDVVPSGLNRWQYGCIKKAVGSTMLFIHSPPNPWTGWLDSFEALSAMPSRHCRGKKHTRAALNIVASYHSNGMVIRLSSLRQ
ncbi:hypothetical protein NQZ68_017401 [Dissostichus eleginoides]|nr:hypothetical protein NQZ68_017401 [Dissostichus eleginoides]